MPLITLDGFAGPANTLRVPNADAERTINLMVETTAPGRGKVPAYLIGTPGLRPRYTLEYGGRPVRGLFEQDGRAFAIDGQFFYELFADGSFANRGAVDGGVQPATMSSNGSAGNQIFATIDGTPYIYDLNTNAITNISSTLDGDIAMGAFMDGYFFALKNNSRQFRISGLEDGLSWDPLDFAERSEGSDNIVALIRNHREIWLLGSQTTEVWYDNGDPDFPFAPIQGAFIEQGASNRDTVQRIDNTLMWLGKNTDGRGVVWRANGYTPDRVSNTAVEFALQRALSRDSIGEQLPRGWVYQEDGHLFYVLVIPQADTSWVYDVSTGLWHERARWDPNDCVWLPHVAGCHCFAFGKHLVGDRFTGVIYEQSMDLYTEEVVA